MEIRKRNLNELPSGKVVGDVYTPPFGIVAGRARVAVVEDVYKQHAAGVVAIEPEANALVATPILREPLIGRGVGEGVGKTSPLAGANRQRFLQHRVACFAIRHGNGRRGGGCNDRTGRRMVPGDVANTHAIAVLPSGKGVVLEVVNDGGADNQPYVIYKEILCPHIYRAKAANGVAVDCGEVEAIVGGTVANFLAVKIVKGKLDEPPPFKVIGNVNAPPFGIVAGRAGVTVILNVNKDNAAGVAAVEPEADALVG